MNKVVLLATPLLALLSAQSAEKKTSQPNIVIIYADDMGYGDLNCQNPDSKIPTPNLDKLASEGMRFTDAHSSSGISSPSRFGMLTGMYHWRRQHDIVNSFGKPFFKDSDITLPQILKSNGYTTACIGKWHLGWDWEFKNLPSGELKNSKGKTDNYYQSQDIDWSKPVKGGPLSRGFDYYFGDGTINFPPYTWFENDRVVEIPTENMLPENIGFKTKEGNWEFRPGPRVKGWNPYEVLPTLTKKTVAWIKSQNANEPFFLYFALPSPHAPIIPNDEFDNKSKAGAYGDFVFQTDWVAGQVLQALKDKGLDENTIVIFSADNGTEYYAFKRAEKFGHFSMGNDRGLKRDVWEGGHHIPFVVKWPGHTKAGSVSTELVSQVDIMATLAKITGAKLPENAAPDSYDFSPVLKGERYKSPIREATVHNTYADKWAIRKGDWLYINAPTGSTSNMPESFKKLKGYTDFNAKVLLFNLKEDPEQRINLSETNPKKCKELDALLKKYRESKRTVKRSNINEPSFKNNNNLSEALQPLPKEAIFKMEGYYIWDPSVIKVGNTYHLFASRWPATEGMIGWKKSHIIRATSKSLFGPYKFAQVVFEPENHPFANQGLHNPKITTIGKKFLLYHLAIPQWKTGFLVADNIEGPWTPVDKPVVNTNNPALLIKADGKVYAVGKFKPKEVKDGRWDAYMQAFKADKIMGPYTLVGDSGNRLPNNFELEDPTIWWANDQYNVICTDWDAKVTGINKSIVYYTSKDGIDYKLYSNLPVWSQREPIPLVGGETLEVRGVERPQVYLDKKNRLKALLVSVYPKDPSEATYVIIRPVDNFVPNNN